MKQDLVNKYRPFPPIELPDRQWPSRQITEAPVWCSVDLRDGNQALIEPMGLGRKRELFQVLVGMGFKQIEIGFPAASQTEFDFARLLVDEDLIPDDVTVQVLTQAREHLIRRTFEGLKGVKRAILHLYNSTSELQRRVVFKMERAGIQKLAVDGTKMVRELAKETDTEITLEYSPESFTGTELDFAAEVCAAVGETWGATAERPFIVNLPATVEMSTPNVHADQIEWFCRHVRGRDSMIVSVHPHNDRGTAVAAAELALMAGAQRVEGTLFGNGERTGNVDLVTLALNMFTQGVNPNLHLHELDRIAEVATACTKLPIHPRHPYAGELVFTAFSGSHQDAIKKGMSYREGADDSESCWEVPYLPIDPEDIGKTYEAVVRINSQSGKGGVAYVLKSEYGIELPRGVQVEFSQVIQQITDESGKEITPRQIREAFEREYLHVEGPILYEDHQTASDPDRGTRVLTLDVTVDGEPRQLQGYGNGPIASFVDALRTELGISVGVRDYQERSVGAGAEAKAIAFIELSGLGTGGRCFGVGLDENIVTASILAMVNALNRRWPEIKRHASSPPPPPGATAEVAE